MFFSFLFLGAPEPFFFWEEGRRRNGFFFWAMEPFFLEGGALEGCPRFSWPATFNRKTWFNPKSGFWVLGFRCCLGGLGVVEGGCMIVWRA